MRRAHYDAGEFALAFGDEGHANGWCLYKLGCKGPDTFNSCPTTRWNSGTSWPVQAGHGCIGCAEPDFWDTMTPFYNRLPDVAGFRLTYLTRDNAWIDRWPVAGDADLPRAVRVQLTLSSGETIERWLALR